ncbi:MAG: hypothetical protein LUG52_06440 [Clostridia bacterium]|nr:hypothetical protein [Clostridia bacterium]
MNCVRENLSEALNGRKSEYLSIGIADTEKGHNAFYVPWDHTSNAMNMKIPDVYITKDELSDESVMRRIKEFKVIGCYIDIPLDDYEFLKEFPYIRDLNILRGENVTDLAFLRELKQCRMLYMENVTARDLKPILTAKHETKGQGIFDNPYVCVGLYDCKIGDISGFDDLELFFSEFIVWNPKERNEKNRWRKMCGGKVRYYEIK